MSMAGFAVHHKVPGKIEDEWNYCAAKASRKQEMNECDVDMFFKSPHRSFWSFDVGCFWVYT